MQIKYLIISIFIAFNFISCIQTEPLNAECDILQVILEDENIKEPAIIENNKITFLTKRTIDLTAQAPEFILTEGATIEPLSGTVRNFTTPQYYTVTSQDGLWSKSYKVMFSMEPMVRSFHFEHHEVRNKYYVFYEQTSSERQDIWATGNPAFSLTGLGSNSERFPTSIEENGFSGNAVKLVTKDAGFFGSLKKMPIAAGNLFIGQFETINAINNPRKATLFGLPFDGKPISLTGWYKYTPGSKVTDQNKKEIVGAIDQPDIYAVLFEPTLEKPQLDGENILTDESIIAIARLSDHEPKEQFSRFEIPFIYKNEKEIDQEKILNSEYKITVVFSSSLQGDHFIGAIGSTLIVDEVEIVCE